MGRGLVARFLLPGLLTTKFTNLVLCRHRKKRLETQLFVCLLWERDSCCNHVPQQLPSNLALASWIRALRKVAGGQLERQLDRPAGGSPIHSLPLQEYPKVMLYVYVASW